MALDMKTVSYMAFNFLSSIGIIFINKAVFKSFGFKFAGKGWVDAPKGKWYTGFYRGKGQGLGDIQKAKACTIARGF